MKRKRISTTQHPGGKSKTASGISQASKQNKAEQAVATREQLASIVDASDDAILSKTLDGVITSWNRGAELMYGYSANEAIGHSISFIIPRDRPNELIDILKRIQHGEHIEHYETVRLRKDAKNIDISISVSPILDDAGKIVGASTIARDITERKSAQEKLQRQNERLKVLREIDTAILQADSLENIVGAALSHIRELVYCQRSNLTLIDWETNESVIFEVSALNETAIPRGRRFPLAQYQDIIQTLSRDQTLIMNDLRALADPRPAVQSLITDGLQSLCSLPLFFRGSLIGMLSMYSDTPGYFVEEKINLGREVANQVAIAIAQRRLVESVRQSEQNFSKAFNSSPVALLITRRADGRHLELNRAYTELVGYERTELLGHLTTEFNIFINPDQRKEIATQLLDRGSLHNYEAQIENSAGQLLIVLASLEQIQFSGEDCILTTLVNITRRKEAEQQVFQLNRLYATLSQVNQTIVRVKDADDLYRSICNVAIEFGGFTLASVGLLDEATGEVKPVAAGGLDLANWPFENVNIKQGAFSNGLLATAIHTSAVVTSEDLQSDQRSQNSRAQVEKYDYHYTAAVPFQLRGKTIGVLSLVSNEVGFFKKGQEIRLLEEMGLDISFALNTIQAEAEHREAEEEHHKSEKKFSSAFHNSPAAMTITRIADGTFIDVNDEFLNTFEFTRDEVIGHTSIELGMLGPEARRLLIESQLATGGLQNAEIEAQSRSGRTITILFSSSPIDINNEAHHLTTMIDITERKQAEKTISQLAAIVESSDEAIIGQSLEGSIVSWNSAAARLYGYSADEIIGRPASILYPPTQSDDAARIIERLKAGEHIGHIETMHVRKNGQPISLSAALSPVKDANGELIGASSIERDLTERQRARETLRRVSSLENSQRRFRTFREITVITLIGLVIVLGLSYYFDLFEWLTGILSTHDLFDELFFGLIYLVFSFAFVSYRQRREADAEVKRRQQAQEALQILHSDLDTRVQERTSDLVQTNVALNSEIAARKKAEEEIQRQVRNLSSLRQIDTAISASTDIRVALDVVIRQTLSQLQVDAASILLFNPHILTLDYAIGSGFRSNAIQKTHLKLDEGYAGHAVLERRTIHIPNFFEGGSALAQIMLLAHEDFLDYYAVPLIAKGQVKGVLETFHRALVARDADWLEFLETLGGQAAIAIDNAQLFSGLERSNIDLTLAYDEAIAGWSAAMDLRDKETEGHSQRVTAMTVKLARTMEINESELMNIRHGALLHDMGKLGVPDHILLKPGKLTDEEWEIMRKHPSYAYDLLFPIKHLGPALDIPYCHHEKWDGSGYPRGLKNSQIPFAARIFAIVDVWDALTSDRPYRAAWSKEKAIEYIQEQSGKHFDPKVVEAFLIMIANQ